MEFLQQILSICGAISIVGGAGAIVVKVIRPAFLLNKMTKYSAFFFFRKKLQAAPRLFFVLERKNLHILRRGFLHCIYGFLLESIGLPYFLSLLCILV